MFTFPRPVARLPARLLRHAALLACLLLGLALTPAARAQGAPAGEVSIDIVWSGVVGAPDANGERADPEKTDRVPAQLGVEFGFVFILRGVPEGTTVKLRQVARYPQPGRRNPQRRGLQKTEESEAECIAGEECSTSYTLDTTDEVIPGEWRLEVQYRGKKIGEQRFVMRYEGV